MTSTETEPLQKINYGNSIGYFLNTLVTYGVGVSGLFPSNAELSAKYQTLVTPAGFAFAIWGIIFISELIWAAAQMLPQYRAKTEVLFGVGWNYVYACIAQIAWTLCFTSEHILLSLIAMISILGPLLNILTRNSKIPSESIGLYWLLKFPFEIHASWIMAATLVNANVLIVASEVDSNIQVVAAWASLIILGTVALYYTFRQKWVVPSVLAWASNAIEAELSNPRQSIVDAFSAESINSIKMGAGILAKGILVCVLARYIYKLINNSDGTHQNTEAPTTESMQEPLTQE